MKALNLCSVSESHLSDRLHEYHYAMERPLKMVGVRGFVENPEEERRRKPATSCSQSKPAVGGGLHIFNYIQNFDIKRLRAMAANYSTVVINTSFVKCEAHQSGMVYLNCFRFISTLSIVGRIRLRIRLLGKNGRFEDRPALQNC